MPRLAFQRVPWGLAAIAAWAFVFACVCSAASAADPWHAEGWPHRAVIVTEKGGSEGVDTAIVRLHHAGLAQDNANDLRLFDSAGKPVPYEVAYHDPQRDALLRFRVDAADAPGGTFHLYFGNDNAPRDPHRVRTPPPGEGPPQPALAGGDWIPRAGLILPTHRRPGEAENPRNLDEMRTLLADSPGPDGAGDEHPAVQQKFREPRGEPTHDEDGRPINYRLRYLYTTKVPVGGSDEWKTYSHRQPRHPNSRVITENVRWVRVMLYPHWPAGEYWYDNIRLVEVDPVKEQADPEAEEADYEEGKVVR